MQLADYPDHVVRHEPGACAGCGAGLADAAETGVERRQVTEIPPVKAEVTGHQLIERECRCCGTRTKADAPDGVRAPVQYGPRAAALGTYLWHGQFLSRDRAGAALAEMFGCVPSPAVIATAAKKIAAEVLDKHAGYFRDAAAAGIVRNAARRGKLQKKRHALATRMRPRRGLPAVRPRPARRFRQQRSRSGSSG